MSKNTRWDYGHGILTGVTALQQRKLRSDLGRMETAHTEAVERAQRETNYAIAKSTEITLGAIKDVRDLQVATMLGMVDMDRKLDEISEAAWDLVNYFKDKHERESFLKGLYFQLKKEMDHIRMYSLDYPEYAVIQLESLQQIIEQKGLTPDHFLFLANMDDIEKAQELIHSVDDLHYELLNSLGG